MVWVELAMKYPIRIETCRVACFSDFVACIADNFFPNMGHVTLILCLYYKSKFIISIFHCERSFLSTFTLSLFIIILSYIECQLAKRLFFISLYTKNILPLPGRTVIANAYQIVLATMGNSD